MHSIGPHTTARSCRRVRHEGQVVWVTCCCVSERLVAKQLVCLCMQLAHAKASPDIRDSVVVPALPHVHATPGAYGKNHLCMPLAEPRQTSLVG